MVANLLDAITLPRGAHYGVRDQLIIVAERNEVCAMVLGDRHPAHRSLLRYPAYFYLARSVHSSLDVVCCN